AAGTRWLSADNPEFGCSLPQQRGDHATRGCGLGVPELWGFLVSLAYRRAQRRIRVGRPYPEPGGEGTRQRGTPVGGSRPHGKRLSVAPLRWYAAASSDRPCVGRQATGAAD